MPDTFPIRRLQALLHQQIPLAREMAAQILRWDAVGLDMAAPLEPNVNHHGTFFGGSAAALGILAGWSLVHLACLDEGLEGEIVIQRVAMRYAAPAPGPVVARAHRPEARAWTRFVSGFRRHGRARMRVGVELSCAGVLVATLDAAYGAVARESS